jgi:hypothetical protein
LFVFKEKKHLPWESTAAQKMVERAVRAGSK